MSDREPQPADLDDLERTHCRVTETFAKSRGSPRLLPICYRLRFVLGKTLRTCKLARVLDTSENPRVVGSIPTLGTTTSGSSGFFSKCGGMCAFWVNASFTSRTAL